jgi:nitrate reductase NapE component
MANAPGGQPPMGGYPGGPQWGRPGPGQPPGQPYQQHRPQKPRKKRRGCGCGCFTFLFVLFVVLALGYLQFWGVWDWMYDIFGVGAPPGISDNWIWD